MIHRPGNAGPVVRFALVLFTGGLMTFNYYLFSHYIHHHRFHSHGRPHEDNHGQHHRPFEGGYMKVDGLFLYGFALPLTLMTLASLVWNPTPNLQSKETFFIRHSRGDVNVWKWTIIGFVVPLLLINYDSAYGHFSGGRSQEKEAMHWSWITSVLTSLMSPSGYAAVWSLSCFLIPVTKHSPILDWLGVTPVQALAFHRVSGWTSLWCSILHGFLHLRHLMGVLFRPPREETPWYQKLWILLVPPSWECITNQNPLAFYNGQDHEHRDDQCWLALINGTGMMSCIAFVLLAITSLPKVRRYNYSLFYRIHIPASWIMLATAIWHYPTCGLVLIPNIIYYLSFNIPIYVTQTMDSWKKKKSSPLVEASLIRGGTIELIFACSPEDIHRHEQRYARLYHSNVSKTSHPYSVFSPQELEDMNSQTSPLKTLSILLRPMGPFNEGLRKILFPHRDVVPDEGDPNAELAEPFLATHESSHDKIQFDSFYAGSFHWLDRAMLSHDQILLVAGGVGIVPFLDFLPSLKARILGDVGSVGDSEESVLLSNTTVAGPELIHLHWYCRDIGLAAHIWKRYLRPHAQQWESNTACQGRLKIHLHLTSSVGDSTCTEEDLLNIADSGIAHKKDYSANGNINPLKDANFARSMWLGLLLPGIIMMAGTAIHWYWYKVVTLDDEFRDDNLIMRTHSIILTFLVALIISIIVEHVHRYCGRLPGATTVEDVQIDNGDEEGCEDFANSSFLKICKGRPAVESVIERILKAKRPGIYMCGPSALMKSIEKNIRKERRGCAFYKEDSEI